MNTASPVARIGQPSRDPARLIRMIRWLAERFAAMAKPSCAGLRTDPQPPQPWKKPVGMFLVGQIAIAVAIAVTAGMLIVQLRNHALAEATREQQRLSLILADQGERSLEAVELVQSGLVERLKHDGVRSRGAFREYMSGPLMQAELSGRGRMLPQLDAIQIIDADGNLINSSRPVLGPEVNVADRDYFRALRDDPGRTTFISQPLQSRTTGKWTAYLARRVAGPDGELLGLILGSLRLRYFEELYHSASLGPDGAFVLRRQDGIVLVRDPPIDFALTQSAAIRLLAPEPVDANGVTYRQISPISGQDRLIVERSLLHGALVVGVTNTIAAVLAEWHRLTIWIVAAAIVLELVVAGAGLLVLQQLRNQTGPGPRASRPAQSGSRQETGRSRTGGGAGAVARRSRTWRAKSPVRCCPQQHVAGAVHVRLRGLFGRGQRQGRRIVRRTGWQHRSRYDVRRCARSACQQLEPGAGGHRGDGGQHPKIVR